MRDPAEALATALSVVDQLRRQGVPCVLAGGCARDILHDRYPKDFDIVVLDDFDQEAALDCIPSAAKEIEFFGPGTSMRDCEDANLDWVVKFEVDGVPFDLIQFSTIPGTPREVVESFDCTLNMAWFDEDGNVVKHSMYPDPGARVHLTRLCDYPWRRVQYLSQKYPEYQWPTLEEVSTHPNFKEGT